jgi:hypothetical protein
MARSFSWLVVTMFACCSLGQSPPPSGIEGTVSVSPAHPGPTREGIPNSRPMAGATFVLTKDNETVTEFTTDDQGRFKVSVPPGHYTVSLKGRRGGIGHFGPFQVDVSAGQTAKVEWQCDSGMR